MCDVRVYACSPLGRRRPSSSPAINYERVDSFLDAAGLPRLWQVPAGAKASPWSTSTVSAVAAASMSTAAFSSGGPRKSSAEPESGYGGGGSGGGGGADGGGCGRCLVCKLRKIEKGYYEAKDLAAKEGRGFRVSKYEFDPTYKELEELERRSMEPAKYVGAVILSRDHTQLYLGWKRVGASMRTDAPGFLDFAGALRRRDLLNSHGWSPAARRTACMTICTKQCCGECMRRLDWKRTN